MNFDLTISYAGVLDDGPYNDYIMKSLRAVHDDSHFQPQPRSLCRAWRLAKKKTFLYVYFTNTFLIADDPGKSLFFSILFFKQEEPNGTLTPEKDLTALASRRLRKIRTKFSVLSEAWEVRDLIKMFSDGKRSSNLYRLKTRNDSNLRERSGLELSSSNKFAARASWLAGNCGGSSPSSTACFEAILIRGEWS